MTGSLVLYSRVYSFRGFGRGVPNDIVSVYFRYQSLGYLSRTLYCRQSERGLETLTGSLVLCSLVYSFRGVDRRVPNDIVSVFFRYQSLGYLSRTLYCRQSERELETLTGSLVLYSLVYSFCLTVFIGVYTCCGFQMNFDRLASHNSKTEVSLQ